MSYLHISRRMAGYLAAGTGLDRENEIVLAYIIEVLFLNAVNLLFTLLLGWTLGVLPGTAACIAAAVMFRHTAGGAHSNSPWRCALITIALFPALALLASYLSGLKLIYTDILSLAAFLIGLVSVAVLAPADTPAAPVVSPVRRKRLKALSILVFMLIAIAAAFFRKSAWICAGEIQLCLVLSLLWTSFNLSKPGHRLMSLIDRIKI